YVHFTVVLDTSRRLARITGVNVDGAALVEVERGDQWKLDGRIPAGWQAGPEIYAGNDLDRGHLVRRRDPVWGGPEVAARANADTFNYTNAAPQASAFNQSKELWLGLEDHVLGHARAHRLRLSVFTAPVLAAGDPPYRGIRVPLRFWKIVAWNAAVDDDEPGRLAAIGFVVDQSPLVDTGELREPAPGEAPPLGPFRTFQVPIADIAALTGLTMPDLIAADRMPPTIAAAGWRRIEHADEILL
ncbi:MAG TPA: DNA/RNA non-specific endonuclease, partial [Agromyces sp.]